MSDAADQNGESEVGDEETNEKINIIGHGGDNGSGDGDGDGDGEEEDFPLCTLAATGTYPVFQPVFVCRTCHPTPVPSDPLSVAAAAAAAEYDDDDLIRPRPETAAPLPLCLCQGCARFCHPAEKGHDVDYVGLGPCYCDCPSSLLSPSPSSSSLLCRGACVLAKASEKEARRLGLSNNFRPCPIPPPSLPIGRAFADCFPYLRETYILPPLVDPAVCSALRRQAEELVRHTADTHWVPFFPPFDPWSSYSSSSKDGHECGRGRGVRWESLCDLERLAALIYRRHVDAFGLTRAENRDDGDGDGDDSEAGSGGGAEWWVQVKKVTAFPSNGVCGGKERGGPGTADASTRASTAEMVAGGGKDEAIDLHYDKDEDLATSFGIGYFPSLSTVTYLTGEDDECEDDGHDGDSDGDGGIGGGRAPLSNPVAAPTVIFPRAYDDPEAAEDETKEMTCALISHPVRGKHLAFDGRLLHGAPAHEALRRRRRHRRRRRRHRSRCPEREGEKGRERNDENPRNETRSDVGSSMVNVDESTRVDKTIAASIFTTATTRVTFLVNVWPSGRPSGVKILPETVRMNVIRAASSTHAAGVAVADKGGGIGALSAAEAAKPLAFLRVESSSPSLPMMEFRERPLSIVDVGYALCDGDSGNDDRLEGSSELDNDVVEEAEKRRIVLPFVSAGATWIDDEEDGSLFLSMVPPIHSLAPTPVNDEEDKVAVEPGDTVLVRYRRGWGPRLERRWVKEDEGDEEELLA